MQRPYPMHQSTSVWSEDSEQKPVPITGDAER